MSAIVAEARNGDSRLLQQPDSNEETEEPGIGARNASRIAVRANLQQVVESTFDTCRRFWICLIHTLYLGMFAMITYAYYVYTFHHDDFCDQPLALMLLLICVIVFLQSFQQVIIRYLLCYDMGRDGPDEPWRVWFVRWFSLLVAFAWPITAGTMLGLSHECNKQLLLGVKIIVMYYVVLACVWIIVPAFFLSLLVCLTRHGYLRNRNALGEDFINQLPTVTYNADFFNDLPGSHPSTCPICLDSFNADSVIIQTPCNHTFHNRCLGGWLQLARTCPLCRVDLAEAVQEAGCSGDRQVPRDSAVVGTQDGGRTEV